MYAKYLNKEEKMKHANTSQEASKNKKGIRAQLKTTKNRRSKNAHWVKNHAGQKLENREKILQEYEQHHKSILKIKLAKTEKEREARKLVAHKFQEIKELGDVLERKQIRTEVVYESNQTDKK